MRKLLNKPWFVGLLALAAVIFVWVSLPSRRVPSPAAVAVEALQPEAAVSETSLPNATAAPLSIGDALKELAGAPLPRRDPFLARSTATAATAEKTAAPDLTESVSVSAIWIQGSTTYVLVNNRVYQVGDHIGRLTLESANRDGVWLTHWKGRDFVAVGGAFTLITPARQAAAALSLSSES